MVLKNPHPMDFVFVLKETECPKECMKPKGELHKSEIDGMFWNEFDYSTKCEHLQCFVGYDGENVKECDKIKGTYERHYRSKQPIIPSSSGDMRLIVVGKKNSPEKPCQFCGSTTICDCPLEIVEMPFSTRKNVCIVCGKTYVGGREFTCSEKCHKELCKKLVAMFGEFKRVVDAETGKTYRVPTKDILEKGLRHEDLVKYPEWKD